MLLDLTKIDKIMNVRERTLLEVFEQSEKKDFIARHKDLNDCIEVLIDFTDKLSEAKVKIEHWRTYMEVQLVKLAFHSASLSHLLEGTPIKMSRKGKELKFADIGSIFLLKRAQIENYLMFYYLNIQPSSSDEGEFRYFLYELSGLSNRQKYTATHPNNIAQKKKEEKEIEILIDKIKNNKFFQTLDIEKQNYFLSKTPARIVGWEKLIENSHLNKFFIENWKHASNYAHSEMIGSIQIKDYLKNPSELNNLIFHTTEQAIILVCIAIKDLTKVFKILEIQYNSFPETLTTKIDFWNRIGLKTN